MIQDLHTQSTIPETVVGNSLKVDGDLNSDGDIRVDGEVDGTINTKGSVVIGTDAKINANITAAQIEIAGFVEGDLDISGKTHLLASAELNGNIKTTEISIDAGARFQGQCNMQEKKEEVNDHATRVEEQLAGIKEEKPDKVTEPVIV